MTTLSGHQKSRIFSNEFNIFVFWSICQMLFIMRRLVIIIFLAATVIAKAGEPKFVHIADIEINTAKFAQEIRYFSTRFYLRNRQPAGKHNCFNLIDIVRSKLPESADGDYFIVACSNNDRIVFGLDEIDPQITIIPAVLVFDELTGSIGDTVTAYDQKNKPKGKVDLGPVKQEFAQAVMRKIHLQLRAISPADKKKYLTNNTILFPQDKSTGRWLPEVEKLKIYKIEE
jgi:hypothetical protein